MIQSKIEDALSEGILAGNFGLGDSVEADVEDGKIMFKKVGQSPAQEQVETISEPIL